MFKLAVFFALVVCAFAAAKPGAVFGAAPVAYSAPAIGYSAYSAPVYSGYSAYSAPLAYRAPVAPLAYGAAPLAYGAAPLAYRAHVY